jgi:hypothetical protein
MWYDLNPNLKADNRNQIKKANNYAESFRGILTSLLGSWLTQRQMVDELNNAGVRTARLSFSGSSSIFSQVSYESATRDYVMAVQAPRRSPPTINRKPLGLLRSCMDRLSTRVLRSVSVRRSGKSIGRIFFRRFSRERNPPLSSELNILSLSMTLMWIRIQ